MIAEILSTGDEVLMGDITDTNSSWLCREMKDLGLKVVQVSAVGDDTGIIAKTIETIAGRADICLVTGGLGPTRDDLTARACAMAAGKDLEKNLIALDSMQAFFDSKGWQLTEENQKQALLPEGAKVLVNAQGTAPGFAVNIDGCTFFFMPGVPSEMKAMFKGTVEPEISAMAGRTRPLDVERLMVFGLPESQVGARLSEFPQRFPGIALGFRARFPLIEVKLLRKERPDGEKTDAAGSDPLGRDLAEAKAWAVSCLSPRVISEDGLTLEEEVGRLLTAAGQTLSVAESCTGGLISHMITEVPGASAYFLFSGVTYANEAKTGVLGVAEKTLQDHGAVHEETAKEMAIGARAAGGSDWAVSTTGIAGPTGGSLEKPVGTVCIGVAGPGGASARRFVLDTGDRHKNKQLFAAAALELLRRRLEAPA